MTKYFCDRCGIEISENETTGVVQVPTERRKQGFSVKNITVCPSCKKDYDAIINTLTDIRFIMFDKFFNLKGE